MLRHGTQQQEWMKEWNCIDEKYDSDDMHWTRRGLTFLSITCFNLFIHVIKTSSSSSFIHPIVFFFRYRDQTKLNILRTKFNKLFILFFYLFLYIFIFVFRSCLLLASKWLRRTRFEHKWNKVWTRLSLIIFIFINVILFSSLKWDTFLYHICNKCRQLIHLNVTFISYL